MELARNLIVESVSRLQLPPPPLLGSHQSVAEAVARMKHLRVGCVLVCRSSSRSSGAHETLIGIFTERDLLRRVLAPRRPLTTVLDDVMTVSPVTVSPLEAIGAAVRRMVDGGYRHLPVVVEGTDTLGKVEQRPLGVLSMKHVIHYLVLHFPSTIYNLPPDPAVFPLRAEGA